MNINGEFKLSRNDISLNWPDNSLITQDTIDLMRKQELDAKIEKAAKAIFEHWQFQKSNNIKVMWVEKGNSTKQNEARDYARVALESLEDVLSVYERLNKVFSFNQELIFKLLLESKGKLDDSRAYTGEVLNYIENQFESIEIAKCLLTNIEDSESKYKIEEIINEKVAYSQLIIGIVRERFNDVESFVFNSVIINTNDLKYVRKYWPDNNLN